MVKPARAKAIQVEVVLEEQANEVGPERGDKRQPQRWVAVASGAGALLFCLATYLLQLDRVVGMYVDDAWYVLLAKALATGQGYTLTNSPSQGILPLYPPAFPCLLSLVYRLAPQFPENVWLLKSISIAAMLGVGVTAYFYFVRERRLPPYVALGIAVATVISPPLIFFATATVMSECVFMLSQLLTIVVIERCLRAGKKGRGPYALLGAALASFAFLTRSIGIVLVVGTILYLLKERLLRTAVVFAAAVLLFVGPWTFYASMHAPTAEQQEEQGSYVVRSYLTQLRQSNAAEASLGTATVKDFAARVRLSTLRLMRSEVGFAFVAPLTDFLKGLSPRGGEIFVYSLSLIAIAGFISAARRRVTLAEIVVPLSLIIIVAWPWPPQRFVLPLAPFLIFYILMGVRLVHGLYQRLRQTTNFHAPWTAAAVVVWCAVAINTLSNVGNFLSLHGPPSERPKRVQSFEEVEAMFKWVRETIPQENVIATFNPALVHLYTGHKTIFPDDPTGNWNNWRRPGVRYLVFTPWHREPNFSPTESRYNVVYQSRSNQNLKVIDLGPESPGLP